MKIVIQAGHQNVKYNSIEALRGSTGAPNEMSFNVDIRDKVSDELRARGFEVQGTDANANDDVNITSKDWDLFLAIHYDADVYTTEPKNGGFADFPEPSTDGATTESQRIVGILNDVYFSTTGIPCVTRRSNKNTRYYYMWKYLTAKTPCALIECGVGMHTPQDHQTLHFNRPLVVEGIVRSICKAFNVPYDTTPEPPIDPCATQNDRIVELEKALADIQAILDSTTNAKKEAEDKLVKSEAEVIKLTPLATEWGVVSKMYAVESATSLDAIIRALKEEIAGTQISNPLTQPLKECRSNLALAKKESVKVATKKALLNELFKRFFK